MDLGEIQTRFQNTVSSRSAKPDGATLGIRDGGPITVARRLEIYRYAYFARIEESLDEDFPKLRRRMGRREFSRLSDRFLETRPSHYASLAELSGDFPTFVAEHGGDGAAELSALAAYEWRIVLSNVAPEPKIDSVIHRGENPRFLLHPSVELLETMWEVDRPVKTGRPLSPRPLRLLIARRRRGGISQRLSPSQYEVLSVIVIGSRVDELAPVVRAGRLSPKQVAGWIERWTVQGVILGLVP